MFWECVWVGVKVLIWAFKYLLQWSWGFSSLKVCLGWGKSINISV